MSNCSIYATTYANETYRTNVPPTSFYLSNVDPPIPPRTTARAAAASTPGPSAPRSPSTSSGATATPTSTRAARPPRASPRWPSTWTPSSSRSSPIRTADYPGPQFTIDPLALGLSDGGHSFFTLATNAIGKRAQTSDYPFIVHFDGPSETMTAPTGTVPTWSAMRVAARVTSAAGLPIQWVKFYLDVDADDPALVPGSGLLPTTGTLLGTATSTDSFGQYSVLWDSTHTANGAHSIVAFSTDSVESDTCQYLTFSSAGAFTLVPYVAPSVSVNVAPAQGNQPLPVTFTATVTGGVGPFTYAWAFGDSATANTNPVTHIYAHRGHLHLAPHRDRLPRHRGQRHGHRESLHPAGHRERHQGLRPVPHHSSTARTSSPAAS